jgi:cytochrome c oxidase subunit II
MKDMTRATVLKLLGAIAASTLIISVIMVNIDWMGETASEQKGPIVTMFDVTIVLSTFVFAVVMVMMIYAIWKYRAKPGDESDGEPIHGNTRLEIIWTAIPTVMVIGLGIYATIVLNDIEAEAADAPVMEVEVTAQQFAWRFDYPEQGISSTELHAPVGTQLQMELNALDVLHSFWVPEWGIKRDLVPGAALPGQDEIDNNIVVTPDKTGTYSVVCTELCGWGHATMRAAAVVHPDQQSFDDWVETQPELSEENPSTGVGGGQGAGIYDEQSGD